MTARVSFDAFVAKWKHSAASERSNKDLFLSELCAVLGVPGPRPATGKAKRDSYVFEKSVTVASEKGKTTKFIDLYKEGCFVLEAKQGSEANTGKLGTAKRNTPAWNVAMNAAFGQALEYATFLEKAPPFIIVADLGFCFDVYASFDGTLRYRPYPNALDHRFHLTHLAERADVLRSIFTEPLSLDPSKAAVEVTREVAGHLAELTKRLEKAGHKPEVVADFLMRCIFTMFAEDVGLLPEHVFTKALEEYWLPKPSSFPGGVRTLWSAMNAGTAFGFFGKLLHFNGGLFKNPTALPLSKTDLEVLHAAARCQWNKVEPAIFGALFEGALETKERHKLGAHFTPRPYVERLVRPTLEEPIREEWSATQEKVRGLAEKNRIKAAKTELRAFLQHLSEIRVLDPACGTGNFLYVSLDLLKGIEDEAFALLLALEGGQTELCLDAPEVTPKQFLGIEINPRAKAIAELVLWIGYLQWHFRTKHRGGRPREPVMEDYRNIERRDAVLDHKGQEVVRDKRTGKPVTRWDGETMLPHPATGKLVPDARGRVQENRYKEPGPAHWPKADFIIGNPPFVGNKRMRELLGSGYVDALRQAYPEIPATAEFVMYWWHKAARLALDGQTTRFGFITTNSISHRHQREVVQKAIDARPAGLTLAFAIPDHPWTDAATGADVRIAMTVAGRNTGPGTLLKLPTGVPNVLADGFERRVGTIQADLSIGASVARTAPLESNCGLSFMGVTLVGKGFRLDREGLRSLSLAEKRLPPVVRPYRSGKEVTQTSKDQWVIDFFGMTEEQARREYPRQLQHLATTVLPIRRHNARESYRRAWYIFGEPRSRMRQALRNLRRYIVTLETSKHRIFRFLDGATVPDHSLFAIATDDAAILGVLSSRIHVTFAASAGSRMGVGNDLRWRNNSCFDPFPFPIWPSSSRRQRVIRIAEALDGLRSEQQARHPGLTLTGMYNVLEKLRSGEPLTPKEKTIHEQGLVSVLKKLHDDLDAAVFDAYGWPHDISDEQILEKLVALNAERAAEEANGVIRWLRPEFQAPEEHAAAAAARAERPGIASVKRPKSPGVVAARAKAAAERKRGSSAKR